MSPRKPVASTSLPYAIYARQSRDRDGEGMAVARQIKECHALARKLGLTGDGIVYTDNDVSATSGRRRPEYERLMDALRAGRHSQMLAWHSDRIYRKNTDLEPLITVIEATGVRIYTVQASGDGEVDLTTPDGRMVARILGAVATREVEHKGERQKAANRDRALLGRRSTGGPRPFGYGQTVTSETTDEDGNTIVKRKHIDLDKVNEPEAAAIREAFDRKLRGESDWAIFTDWNERGILTQRGNLWNGIAFRQMIRRPSLAGLVDHKGEILEGVKAAWPAIVPEETWRAVVAGIMRDPKRKARAGRPLRHMLGGVTYCACGKPLMSAVLAQKQNNGAGIYKCSSVRTKRGPNCVSIMRSILEPYVRDCVVEALLRRKEKPPARSTEDLALLAQLNGELGEVQAAQKRLARAIAADVISEDDARTESSANKTRIKQLTARIEAQNRSSVEAAILDDSIAAMFVDAASRPMTQLTEDGTEQFFNTRRALVESAERHGATRAQAIRQAVEGHWEDNPDEYRVELGRRFMALPLDEQRDLIRRLVKVTVKQGRGADRLDCEYL